MNTGSKSIERGLAVPLLLLAVLCSTVRCTNPHVYLSGFLAEPLYEVQTLDGAQNRIRYVCAPGFPVLGLAHWQNTDLFYVRVSPGNRVMEFNRSGQCLRTMIAERVGIGCGFYKEPPELDAFQSCGLTIRWSDGHLFLDQPNAAAQTIIEVDNNGRFVREIKYSPPPHTAVSATSGLGYHQQDDRLWVLFALNQTIVEFDLSGQDIRSFSLVGYNTLANGLAVDSDRDEVIVPGPNGLTIEVYDFQGNRIRTQAINRGAMAGILGGGVAIGGRRGSIFAF